MRAFVCMRSPLSAMATVFVTLTLLSILLVATVAWPVAIAAQNATKVSTESSAPTLRLGDQIWREQNEDESPIDDSPDLWVAVHANGLAAGHEPGPAIVAGAPITWSYHITNHGSITLANLQVTSGESVTAESIACTHVALAPGMAMFCLQTAVATEGQQRTIVTINGESPNGPVMTHAAGYYWGRQQGDPSTAKVSGYLYRTHSEESGTVAGSDDDETFATDDDSDRHSVGLSGVTVVITDSNNFTHPVVTKYGFYSVIVPIGATIAKVDERTLPPGAILVAGSDPSELWATSGTRNFFGAVGYQFPHINAERVLALQKLTNGIDAPEAPGPMLQQGTIVTWTYLITNTGTISVTDIHLYDDPEGVILCPYSTLTPGQAMHCQHHGLVHDGPYVNYAKAYGRANGERVVARSVSHYNGKRPTTEYLELAMTKHINGIEAREAPGLQLEPGTPITWTYQITNHTALIVTELRLHDDPEGLIDCPTTILLPHATMTCLHSGIAKAGQYVNHARLSGYAGNQVARAHAMSYYLGTTDKVAVKGFIYQIYNENSYDSNTAINVAGSATTSGWHDGSGWYDSGIDGVTVTITDSAGVSRRVVTKHGYYLAWVPPGLTTADVDERTLPANSLLSVGEDPSAIFAQENTENFFGVIGYQLQRMPNNAALTLQKLVNGTMASEEPGLIIDEGAPVTWTYIITNHGTITLTDLSLYDNREGSIECPASLLAPGAAMTCTHRASAVHGQYANHAKALAWAGSTPISAYAASYYYGKRPASNLPSLLMHRRINEQDANVPPGPTVTPGTLLQWTYVVTNTTNQPITDIRLHDNVEGLIACPSPSLAPGTSMICYHTALARSGQQQSTTVIEGYRANIIEVAAQIGYYLGEVDDGETAIVKGYLYELFDDSNTVLTDSGSAGLADIEVVIIDSQHVTQTVMTAADGHFTATVPPGQTTAYVIESTLPPGYILVAGSNPMSGMVQAGTETFLGEVGYRFAPSPTPTATSTPSPQSTLTPTDALTATPAATPTATPTDVTANRHLIEIHNNQFGPAQLTIHVGDTVVWRRLDGYHNVRADNQQFRLGDANGNPSNTWTEVEYTFTQTGTWGYYCEVHGAAGGIGMAGQIIVQTDSITVTPTSAVTPTPAPTQTHTDTSTVTSTPTAIPTNHATDTPASIATLTATMTSAATPTAAPTQTHTDSSTVTSTPMVTPTNHASDTPAPTATMTSTATSMVTNTPQPTENATVTATMTSTATNTPLPTATPTDTATNTPLPTATPTDTATNTPLPTATPTSTSTNTPLPTPTDTATNTPLPTATPTDTATNTPLPTATPTSTATDTPLPTATPTSTATNTPLPTATPTNTATNTPLPTATPTSTSTNTPLPTATPTSTATDTPLPTATPTASPTPTLAVVGPDLTVANAEFTQAIQTITNSAPLIADKSLLARLTVGVSNFGGSVANVTAELRAFRNGVELAGSPLAPLSSGTAFTAKENPDRSQMADTLNFTFPANWLTAGDLTIQATVNPDQTIVEGSYANNTQSYLLTFNAINPLEVVLVPIAFQLNGQGAIYRPTLDASTKFGLGYLAELYPIPGVQFTIHSEYAFTGDLYTTAGWSALLSEIRQLRNSEVADPNAPFPKYYGVVTVAPGCCYPGTLTPQPAVGGMGYVPGSAAVGLETTGMIIDFNGDGQPDPGYANPYLTLQEHMASHELGHNFGLGHAPCGTTGAPGFPNTTAEIADVGFYLPLMALVPPTHKDVMSYCFTSPPPRQWVSVYNYERLYNAITTAQSTTVQAGALLGQNTATGWLLAGEIRDGGATGLLYNTRPEQSTAIVREPGEGAYELRIVDANGQLLSRYAFNPDVIEGEDEEVTNVSPPELEPAPVARSFPTNFTAAPSAADGNGSFSFVLPYSSAAAAIQLWHANTLLDQLTVAVAPPILDATFIDDGEALVLTWTATDPDPNYPLVQVRYSADRGVSWQTLAHQLPATELAYRIAKAQLAYTPAGLLEVIAGNSTLSTRVQLEIGAIANKPPKAYIINELGRTYRPGESIVLFGTAIDFEDGTLPAESFTWTIDGFDRAAVTGSQYTLLDGLPAGEYTLRLTVVDADGATATETITVTVMGYSLYLPYVER